MYQFGLMAYSLTRSNDLSEIKELERVRGLVYELLKQMQTKACLINIGYGPPSDAMEALRVALERFAPFVDKNLAEARQNKKIRKQHNQDNAKIQLFTDLIKSYETIFDLKPGRSTDKFGEPTGPLFRFTKAATDACGLSMSDSAIDNLLRRILATTAKPEPHRVTLYATLMTFCERTGITKR